MDPAYAEREGAARKRRRVAEACGACRDRKTRCDGRQPVCQACEDRGVGSSCVYKINRRRRRRPMAIPSESDRESRNAEWVSRRSQYLPTEQSHPSLQRVVDNNTASDASCQPWSSTHSDGLAILAGRHDNSIYGPSSTVAFLRRLLTKSSHDPTTQPTHSLVSAHIPERIPRQNDAMAQLPRRRSADEFLFCYWEFIHPTFPVLHKTTFGKQYEQFWATESRADDVSSDSAGENVIFLSTMNLVFALGCKFSNAIPDAQKESAADGFYQKSRQLSNFDALDSASLPLVQMWLLNGIYLQSTRHANRCWNSIGLAIRVAQGLGLHADLDVRKATSQLEREVRRRVWHTCVNLDRLLAMTFGRPTMINKGNAVPLPAMVDDEFLSEHAEGVQPPETPSYLGLFVSSCTLLELLEKVLEFLSKNEHTPSFESQLEASKYRTEMVMAVLDLNRQLDDFSISIPSYLRVAVQEDSDSPDANRVMLQNHVLDCRFLLTRLLLLRPLLLLTITMDEPKARFPDATGQSMLTNAMIKQCCELCVQTAFRLIDTVYASLRTPYRSSCWHAVYFTFSSAIVLMASLKCSMLSIESNQVDFQTRWDHCLAILEHYQDRVQSASHAINSLKAVQMRIFQNDHVQDEPSRDLVGSDLTPTLGGSLTPAAGPEVGEHHGPDMADAFGMDGFSELYLNTQSTDMTWLELFQLQPNLS
ncbi:fungal-specific transcription factor domain-containing protein [Ilyonectria robusta]|uniref:fungal-specific transcription factor domain-containing protein n=1 Tax=Ilyonectria robusta TaxID=1079257 RepID=UPI001E8DEB8F|nr:fungal-specific transcription factor domain-containing protein [Ilyonectria robusta]KAH8685020.1 fungal-specific transcription factor domain-containing protein [Ilyonectria robusta]